MSVSLVRTLPVSVVSSGPVAISGAGVGAWFVTSTVTVIVSMTPPLVTV